MLFLQMNMPFYIFLPYFLRNRPPPANIVPQARTLLKLPVTSNLASYHEYPWKTIFVSAFGKPFFAEKYCFLFVPK
jgi:hypothetical protein